jgi:primary-amine oxidase
MNETTNMVRVQYGDGNKSQVVVFRRGKPNCMVGDLESYVEDAVVRKFPYDPNDPYFATDSTE